MAHWAMWNGAAERESKQIYRNGIDNNKGFISGYRFVSIQIQIEILN